MKPKNNAPADITLEQSSTGLWAVPAATRQRFKPWQRLWLAVATVYLLMLAGGYYMLMPDRDRIERQLVSAVTEEARRYDGMAFAGESPQKIMAAARSHGYTAWIAATRARYRIGVEGDAGFARIEADYRDAVSGLPMKRLLGVLACAAAWLAPMTLLYAIGSAVDWIKQKLRVFKAG
jgi:hypothetical protein